MGRKAWTTEEDKRLQEKYATTNILQLCEMFPTRSSDAIKLHANNLGLFQDIRTFSQKEGDLSVLLKNDNITFYWVGFLLADGYFSKNNRLSLTLSTKDKEHLEKFASFINCKNIQYGKAGIYSHIGVKVMDSYFLPKIKEKFNISHNKTKIPPNLNFYNFNMQLLLSLYIGFIDGDGCIREQTGRTDCTIRIKCYKTWLTFLQNLGNIIQSELNIPTPDARINNSGYANIIFSNLKILRFLKERAIEYNLPVLKRKWEKIDETRISKYEQAVINKENINKLYKDGMRRTDIATELNLSKSLVTQALK